MEDKQITGETITKIYSLREISLSSFKSSSNLALCLMPVLLQAPLSDSGLFSTIS